MTWDECRDCGFREAPVYIETKEGRFCRECYDVRYPRPDERKEEDDAGQGD